MQLYNKTRYLYTCCSEILYEVSFCWATVRLVTMENISKLVGIEGAWSTMKTIVKTRKLYQFNDSCIMQSLGVYITE